MNLEKQIKEDNKSNSTYIYLLKTRICFLYCISEMETGTEYFLFIYISFFYFFVFFAFFLLLVATEDNLPPCLPDVLLHFIYESSSFPPVWQLIIIIIISIYLSI